MMPRCALMGCMLLAAACAPSAEKAAVVEGQKLTLAERDGKCRMSSPDVDLGIAVPCDFHRRSDGGVRTVRWGKATVALVQSSQPRSDLPGSCRTQIRGVAVAGGKVHVSPHTSNVAQCPPFEWDEVMFKGVFGDKEPGR